MVVCTSYVYYCPLIPSFLFKSEAHARKAAAAAGGSEVWKRPVFHSVATGPYNVYKVSSHKVNGKWRKA